MINAYSYIIFVVPLTKKEERKMARVFSNVIGNFSGKLGNLSARIAYGRTILAARPASFNAPDDAASLNRRSQFLATVKFALQVLDLPALTDIWKKIKPVGISVYNQIVSTNYQFTSPTRPTIDNIITPGGFVVDVPDALLDTDKITGTIPALNTVTLISPDEVHCVFNAVICYHTPLVAGDDPYNIIHLSKTVPNYLFGAVYNLQMDLNIIQKAIAAKYDSSIVYLALATKSAEEKVVQNSATIVKAF